ncbi:hypothetical protein GCM10010486_63790 [Nonomuraea roseoviolacea subsp. carminata]
MRANYVPGKRCERAGVLAQDGTPWRLAIAGHRLPGNTRLRPRTRSCHGDVARSAVECGIDRLERPRVATTRFRQATPLATRRPSMKGRDQRRRERSSNGA